MILLFNVCITPSSSSCNIKYDRGLLPEFSKIDILKYCISSLSVIPFSEAIINIELQSYFKIFEQDVKKYVSEQFKNIKFIYSDRRAKSQKDWQKINNQLSSKSDPLLWYCGNHDHIFMAPDLDVIGSIENKLLNSPDLTYIVYAHQAEFHGSIIQDQDFSYLYLPHLHAMCCLKINNFIEFWSSFDAGDFFIPRTEWFISDSEKDKYISILNWNVFCPHKRCCDHFDGYSHKLPTDYFQPLSIPVGFFDNKLRIKFGGERADGYFYINCFKKHSFFDPNGTDAYWSEEDIPLFWRDKIIETTYDSDYDLVEALEIKNNFYYNYLFYFAPQKSDINFQSNMKSILFG